MDYTQFLLTVNSSSVILLILLAFVLLIATRFRGENGYAAAIIMLPTVPVYLYNTSRMLGWHDLSLFLLPVSSSVNTMLLPLLWLFTKKNFDASFRISALQLLHFLPAGILLLLYLSIPTHQRLENIVYEMSGDDTWIGDLNTGIVLIQQIAYFTAIFRFLYRRKKAIGNTLSDAEWAQKAWIPHFMLLFAGLFVVVMVAYIIWPRTDAWLIQILNVLAMFYLVHNSIAHPAMPMIQAAAPMEIEPETAPTPAIDDEQMKNTCDMASRYLYEMKSYLRPDISLALFAKEIGIPQRTLSTSINGYLHYNFFEFINRMRVEEAKKRLLELETSGYNIDSVYAECGFRSRSTFFLVFKKIEGKTPAAWLREKQTEK